MRVMVTGGAGFIGSHIVDLLLERGHEVGIIDNLSTGKEENIHPNAKFYHADIVQKDNILNIFEQFQPEVVIHHAAQIDVQKSLIDPYFDSQVNILGTISILDAAVSVKCKKIIYASSAALYGTPETLPLTEKSPVQPESFYGISKHTPEHFFPVYHNLYGLEYTVLRYSNVYGPRQDAKGEGGVVSIFTDRLFGGEECMIFGDGNHTRDFIYVKDVAAANDRAIQCGSGQILNVCTNTIISINDLYYQIASLYEVDKAPIYREPRKGDIVHSRLDNKKAIEALNWSPKYSLEDGLTETVAWRKEV